MDHTHEIRRHVTRRTVAPSNFRHATSFSMPSWDTQKVLKNYPGESWGTQKRTQKSFKPTLFVPFRRTQKFHHNEARAWFTCRKSNSCGPRKTAMYDLSGNVARFICFRTEGPFLSMRRANLRQEKNSNEISRPTARRDW